LIDLRRSPVGLFACQKFLSLREGWNAAGQVQSHSAQERAVVTFSRRWQAERLQFCEDVLIDEVGRCWQIRSWLPQRHGRHEGTDVFLKPDHDRRRASTIFDVNSTVMIDLAHVWLIRFVLGHPCDVASGAVAEVRRHDQLLRCLLSDDSTGRRHLDALNYRVIRGTVRQPCGNPATQQFVFVAAGLDPCSASVRHDAAGFAKDETFIRSRWEDSPPSRLFRQKLVIAFRFEAEQRKAEVILTGRRAVARAAVTPGSRELRNDVVGKADIAFFFDRRNDNRNRRRVLAEPRCDDGPTVRKRRDKPGSVDRGDGRRLNLKSHIGSHIDRLAVNDSRNNQLLTGSGVVQSDASSRTFKLKRGAFRHRARQGGDQCRQNRKWMHGRRRKRHGITRRGSHQ